MARKINTCTSSAWEELPKFTENTFWKNGFKMYSEFTVWSMSYLMLFSGRSVWPTLQPTARGRSRSFGFAVKELSSWPSLFCHFVVWRSIKPVRISTCCHGWYLVGSGETQAAITEHLYLKSWGWEHMSIQHGNHTDSTTSLRKIKNVWSKIPSSRRSKSCDPSQEKWNCCWSLTESQKVGLIGFILQRLWMSVQSLTSSSQWYFQCGPNWRRPSHP